ncbi:MAG: hypothetical protein AB7F86_14515 [Bdellovibrionales bacterium]
MGQLLVLLAFATIVGCSGPTLNNRKPAALPPSCPNCETLAPSFALPFGQGIHSAQMCENPSVAICELPSHSQWLSTRMKTMAEEEVRIRKSLLQIALQKKGAYDLNYWFKGLAKDAGFVLETTDFENQFLSQNASSSSGAVKLPSQSFCDSQKSLLEPWSVDSAEKLSALDRQVERFTETTKPILRRLAIDNPMAFLDLLSERCEELRKAVDPRANEDKNPQTLTENVLANLKTIYTKSACLPGATIRTFAVRLHQGLLKPDDGALKKFIEDQLPVLMADLSTPPSASSPDTPQAAFRLKAQEKATSVGNSCAAMSQLFLRFLAQQKETLTTDALQSKEVLERLLYETMPSFTVTRLEKEFALAQSAIAEAVRQSGLSTSLKEEISKSFEKVKFTPLKIDDSLFDTKTARLDPALLDPNHPIIYLLDWNSLFQFNASYNPLNMQIMVTPMFGKFTEGHPMSSVMVFMHENGHHIDTNQALFPTLKKEMREMIGCLRDRIRMTASQTGETVADFWASQGLQILLRDLPKEHQVNLFTGAHTVFCMFDRGEPNLSFRSTHPHPMLRAGTIPSLSPLFQNIFSCRKSEPQTPNCQWPGDNAWEPPY